MYNSILRKFRKLLKCNLEIQEKGTQCPGLLFCFRKENGQYACLSKLLLNWSMPEACNALDSVSIQFKILPQFKENRYAIN
jgi:hypothetical protein